MSCNFESKTLWGCHCMHAGGARVPQVAPVVKSLPANAGDIRDVGSVPGSGRPTGGAHGNPLQYSCL